VVLLRLLSLHWHAFIVETALTATKNCTLYSTLVTFTVFFETFCLLAFAPLFYSFRLYTQTEPLGLRQILSLLIIDKPMNIASEGIDDCLLMLFFVGGVVAAGVAITVF
jgi:hypothetical protein